MSWLSQNYEKAAVGGAAVLALGLATMGWLKVGGVPEDFPPPVSPAEGKGIEVAGAGIVNQATASLKRDLAWKPIELGGRQVELFQGIPLFIHRDKPDEVIDVFTAQPLHPPIPNTWWLQYRLDPGFADSPQRDDDGDGFNALEEFTAKTDPTDKASHPTLLDKLMYHQDVSVVWSLRPSFPDADKLSARYYEEPAPPDGELPKSLTVRNKTNMGANVEKGGTLFEKDPAKERFKFLGFETKEEVNPRLNIKEKVTRAQIQDLKPNKKHLPPYTPPAPLSESRIWDEAHFDRSATLSLEAAGNEGKNVDIEEFTDFGLPLDNPKKEYRLKSVTPQQVEVEIIETKATVIIPKGGYPNREK